MVSSSPRKAWISGGRGSSPLPLGWHGAQGTERAESHDPEVLPPEARGVTGLGVPGSLPEEG